MNTRPRARFGLCPACSRPHGRTAGWRYCSDCQREYDRWRRKARPRKCARCPARLPKGASAWLCPDCRRQYNNAALRGHCSLCGDWANRQHSMCGHCRYLARTGRLERVKATALAFRIEEGDTRGN